MRDSMKITIPYQFVNILITHLEIAGVAFVFQTVAFWYFLEKPITKPILGIIFTVLYFGMMYRKSHKLSELDYKPYTPLKPNILKGVMFGVMISVLTFVMYIGYRIIWAKFAAEAGLMGMGAISYNFIFSFWTFPFYGIMDADNGNISIVGQIVIFAVPIISTTLGYIAGKYNFEILDKFEAFIYEKPEK